MRYFRGLVGGAWFKLWKLWICGWLEDAASVSFPLSYSIHYVISVP